MRINVFKKCTATILAILLIISIYPTMLFGIPAAADSENCYTYTVQDGNATITAVDASISGNITIPDALGGCSVTGIGDRAFSKCTELTGITIGNGVASIGKYAFDGCTKLTSITIGNGIKSIGFGAFAACSALKKVNITDIGVWCNINFNTTSYPYSSNPLYIAKSLYLNNQLVTDLVIPDGVTGINDIAFCNCEQFTSVTIPGSVTKIGLSAFQGCVELKSVTIGAGVTSIGPSAFKGCTKLASITIPDNVTILNSSAFENCTELSSITLGNGVESIGSSAFAGCTRLTELTIPASVTKMESSVFNGCTGLTSVTISDTVTNLGNNTFQNCTGLTHATIGGSIERIGTNTFYGCTNLKDVQISNSVTEIGNYAFYGCGQLTDINYVGNQSDWKNIKIGSNNDPLSNAKLNCNCTGIVGMRVLEALEPKPKFKYRQNVGKLDLTVGSVEVTRLGGTTFQSILSELTVTGFNNVTLGDCVLTLIYDSFSIKMTVEIVKSQAEAIDIIEKPKKLFYKTGEALDVTGGLLKIAYYDDSFEEIDMTVATLTGYDSQKYGKQTITAKYDGQTATFTVEVYTPGDIDGDKHIGASDITQLRKYLLSVITGNVKFDVNGDDQINILDLVRIKRLAVK